MMVEHALLDALTDRIHRACLTVATFPDGAPRGFYTLWPAYRLDWWDAEDAGAARGDEAVTERLIAAPVFAPTAAEIDDCMPALELLEGAQPLAFKVVSARAHQLWYNRAEDAGPWAGGWRGIGSAFRISHTAARKIHWRTMHYALGRLIERQSVAGR